MKDEYILYVKNGCPYCQKAIAVLGNNNCLYRSLALDDYQIVLDGIKDLYDWHTVPMVFKKKFKDYRLLGGYDDLIKHLRDEEGLNV